MFDIVRNNKKFAQGILALITLPFAFWGVESYVRNSGGGSDTVASVGGSKISLGEFQQALREQQDRLRPSLGGRDPALLNSPELQQAVLDNLIQRRLLNLDASKGKLSVSNEQLVGFITSVPQLKDNGVFSQQRYEALIAGQNMSKAAFEANLRQDMIIQQAAAAIGNGALPGKMTADRWLAAQLEEREVSDIVLRPDPFLAQVKTTPEAIRAYYDANQKKFELPEQVKVEYVVLSAATMQGLVQLPAEEVQKAVDAANKVRNEAKGRADLILAEVRKDPTRFADLAREKSDDTGSKVNGGDLGFFGRGAMVKPFEDAVFHMKVGEISGLVESDFGFHIIKLIGTRKGSNGEERQASHILVAKPEGARSSGQTRAEVETELKREKASKLYAETAEAFTNSVYEQADSLAPTAEKFKLTVEHSDWLNKGGAVAGPLANPKLQAALFSDEAIKNKRNTEAVEIAPNVLVSARVVEHKAAALQPLETVTPVIAKLLAREEAVKLAVKDGEAKLAQLAKGEKVDLTWGKPRTLTKGTTTDMPPDVAQAIFKADVAKLPAYAGVGAPGGYALFRISHVKPYAADSSETPQAKALRAQYARLVAEEELAAWVATLKTKYPVEINRAAFENKEK
jgi:peptidyl-prolyl cis-trans isomerase D